MSLIRLFHRKVLKFLIYFVVATLITISLSCSSFGNAGSDAGSDDLLSQRQNRGTSVSTTVNYSDAASNSDLTSLDIYTTSQERPSATADSTQDLKPVVVFVHGGGFRRGDKSNQGSKAEFFNSHGIQFVSVNYRLASSGTDRVMYPTFVEDVAQAVAWIHNNAEGFGGDPDQIYLMGHSAGGYIVNVLGLEEQFLQDVGLSTDDIQGIISLDSGLFDLVEDYERSGSQARLIENAFGNNLSTLEEASPINQVGSSDENIPPFFFTYTNQRKAQKTDNLADLIRQTGTLVVTESSIGRSHSDVNRQFGTPGDPLAEPVLNFIEETADSEVVTVNSSSTSLVAQAEPISDKTSFALIYSHERPASQATALLDAFEDGTLDLAIAAKRRAYLVRNQGNMSFEDSSTLAANNANGWGMHDFNQDGLMDLFVAQEEGRTKDSLFNQGDGSFLPKDLGNETRGNARSVIFADFDGDGYVDSFSSVSSFQENHFGASLHPGQPGGTFGPDIIENILSPAQSNFWYAMADPPGRGQEKWSNKQMKGTITRDFDGDGKPDIVFGAYADRGFQEGGQGSYAWQWIEKQNRGLFVLHNTSTPGNFQFEEVSKQALGSDAYGNTTTDWNVYSVIPIDYDHDGDQDLFAGATVRPADNRQSEDTDVVRFYENRSTPGDIRFVERTDEAGFSAINQLPPRERSQRSFAAGQAIDYDNDTWEDLFLVNRRNPDRTQFPYVHLYRNLGDGTFQEINFAQHGIGDGSGGRDLVGGDLDGDGWIDIVLNDGAVGGFDGKNTTRIYRNQSQNSNNWIKLNLVRAENGTPAIGAKLWIYQSGTSNIIGYDEVRTDFCYRSKRSPFLQFGTGNIDTVDLRITTRDGEQYKFDNLGVDKTHRFVLN